SWRWLFIFGSIPIAVGIFLVHKYVPESPIRTPSRVDYVGATLLSGGLICLLLALTEGESWGWTSAGVLGLFAGSALFLAGWVLAELRVADPMVDMHVFAQRQVLLTNITALIVGFALFGTFVLIPNLIGGTQGPELRGYEVAFGISAVAALIGAVIALFVTPIGVRRKESDAVLGLVPPGRAGGGVPSGTRE